MMNDLWTNLVVTVGDLPCWFLAVGLPAAAVVGLAASLLLVRCGEAR
jgi:hypothetical protein